MAKPVEDFDVLKEKILHTLTIYPKISPSMLQVGLGPHNRPEHWRPALHALIDEGLIKQEELIAGNPHGQKRSYTVISLVKKGSGAKHVA